MKIQNDLTRGKYDVRVGVGPSFRTRRIEAASSIVELGSVFPQVMQVAGDLVAKNLDWPGADELADRLQKVIKQTMPGIIDEELTPEQQQAQQQQAQQQQQLQQTAVQLQLSEQQAKIENTQADTANKQSSAVKSFSETEQNDVENAVQVAELAAASGDMALLNESLAQVTQLLRNGGNPPPTAGMAG